MIMPKGVREPPEVQLEKENKAKEKIQKDKVSAEMERRKKRSFLTSVSI